MAELEYLATYGQGAFLGRFRAPALHARGDCVVLRSDRGVELGTVLEEARSSAVSGVGSILRRATAEDRDRGARCRSRAASILADAEGEARDRGLPLMFLDAEVLLDDSQAILQAVHWADCDATRLFESLTVRHSLPVRLADLTTEPRAAVAGCATCGAEKSGCGSCGTGGGCSTGSCSRGSVRSADDLTAYFAGLRQQMEAAGRVSLH